MKLILAILLLYAPALANEPTFAATVVRVIDGDTLVATVHLPWGVDLRERTFRAIGYDAWETSKRRKSVSVTTNEVARGKEAKADLEKLLDDGLRVSPPNVSDRDIDPYDRDAARFYFQRGGRWLPVAEWMREHGHTRFRPAN